MAIPEKDAPGIARGRMNSLFLFPSPGLSQNAILEVSHVVLGFYKKKVSISLTLGSRNGSIPHATKTLPNRSPCFMRKEGKSGCYEGVHHVRG